MLKCTDVTIAVCIPGTWIWIVVVQISENIKGLGGAVWRGGRQPRNLCFNSWEKLLSDGSQSVNAKYCHLPIRNNTNN